MVADQDTFAALQGVTQDGNGNPTSTGLPWRPVRVRGRQIPNGLAKTSWGNLIPFAFPNASSPTTTSAFDQLEGTAEQIASRWIDPYGNVVNFFTVWVVQWIWFLGGCQTNISQKTLANYLTLANQLNPWPNNYPGISTTQFPGENFANYPAWPPATAVPIGSFLPTSANPSGSSAAGPL